MSGAVLNSIKRSYLSSYSLTTTREIVISPVAAMVRKFMNGLSPAVTPTGPRCWEKIMGRATCRVNNDSHQLQGLTQHAAVSAVGVNSVVGR